MMVIAENVRGGKVEFDIPETKSFTDSKIFYESSPRFKRAHKEVKFAPGFKCGQCAKLSRHRGMQSGYCYFHKRIVDTNETCDRNSRSEYRNVNTPVRKIVPQPLKEVYTPIAEW